MTARTVSSPAFGAELARAVCSVLMRPASLRYVALWLVLLTGRSGGALADNGDSTTLYRWVDAQGVTHFSDTPQPGAEKMQVAPAQTFSAARVAGSQSPQPPSSGGVYQSCDIVTPTAEQSFYAPESVGVFVRLVPALRAGDLLSVSLDGTQLNPTGDDARSFVIPNPDRGAHTARAEIRDAAGNTLCSSMAVTFYVQRPSLLSPQSPTGTRPTPPHH